MRTARVFINAIPVGVLIEQPQGKFDFQYDENYQGYPVSLTMPVNQKYYQFDQFPPFFEGLLPEGPQLEGLLRQSKLDRYDYFSQLMTVGADLVGAVTVEEIT